MGLGYGGEWRALVVGAERGEDQGVCLVVAAFEVRVAAYDRGEDVVFARVAFPGGVPLDGCGWCDRDVVVGLPQVMSDEPPHAGELVVGGSLGAERWAFDDDEAGA